MLSLFELESEGYRTMLTIRWLPINSTEEERATFAGAMDSMTKGWSGTFDQLADYLAGTAAIR